MLYTENNNDGFLIVEDTLLEVSGEFRRLQIFYEDNWVLARDIKTGIIEQGTSLKYAKNNIIKILELQM